MASPSTTQHVLDIDELSASTKEKLQMLPPLSSERCIYTAPLDMRSSCEQHFTPQIVSIGPLHYQNEKLRANEHLKERYLAEFCELTQVSLKECYKLILEHERRLRNCYADVIELNSENFVKMVLVDSAFLLMILLYNYFRRLVRDNDMLYKNPKMINGIRYDLLLLENQLPFFILEDLYKLSKLQSILKSMFNGDYNMEKVTVTFLTRHFFKYSLVPQVLEQHPPPKPAHILDLYRSCLIPADWNPKWHELETRNMPIETRNMPSTKKLYQAGVKIQVGCKENMFDIRFCDGILEIPPSMICDYTELIYRNILAYELCHFPTMNFFSNYFQMMRMLTLSSEDADLLVQNGVIINAIPNVEQVSTLFQKINVGTIVDAYKFLYADVVKDLNKYYKQDWHKWKATLKERYFKAPWAICSVYVAIVLLVLTTVQTVFTILQVVLPK